MKIEFLNHASVRILTKQCSIASDPWYGGSAFHNGWDLIHQDPALNEIASNSDYIWISHEHPDHFSVPFFDRVKPKAKLLFQLTADRRVTKFLEGRGFGVTEIADGAAYETAPGEEFRIGKFDFYDSWSLLRAEGLSILNLNDCPFNDEGDLRRLKAQVGQVDVLLTQFSYAAWQGGRAHRGLRQAAADRKLEIVRRQVEILRPTYVIPFASFVYFSHAENSYLNDCVNTVDRFIEFCEGLPCRCIAMKPMDTWTVGEAWDNEGAAAFWREAYRGIPQLPFHSAQRVTPLEELQSSFLAYREKIYEKNSKMLIRMLSWLPMLGAFRPMTIRIPDLGRVARFSFFEGFSEPAPGAVPDAEISTENLRFLFENDFGYDTLTVNGRFEATPAGFSMMTKNFAVGSLNAMGLAVHPSLVLRLDVVILLLRTLHGFLRKMNQAKVEEVVRAS